MEESDALLEVISEALAAGRALHLLYFIPSQDEVSERTVDPICISMIRGRPYLDAWCRSAQERRIFRLDRVVRVDVLDEPAVVPEYVKEQPLTDSPGQLVRDAQALVDAASEVLKAAVVAERFKGTQWDEIASALDVQRSSAHGRFAKSVTQFRELVERANDQAVPESPKAVAEEVAPVALDNAWNQVAVLLEGRSVRSGLRHVAERVTTQSAQAKAKSRTLHGGGTGRRKAARAADPEAETRVEHAAGLLRKYTDHLSAELSSECWYDTDVAIPLCLRGGERADDEPLPPALVVELRNQYAHEPRRFVYLDAAALEHLADRPNSLKWLTHHRDNDPVTNEEDRLAAIERRLAALETATEAAPQARAA